MVSSISNNSNLSQIALWLQQQAQLKAAHANPGANGASGNPGSSQAAPLASNNNLFSGSQGLGGDALLVLLQNQQIIPSAVSGDTSGQSAEQPSSVQKDFQNLVSSLSSGDLAGAQQAYTALTQLQTDNGTNDPNTSTPSGQAGQNSFQQALSQIGNDLQSGNITAAQQTLDSLQSTKGGHHHHHRGGEGGNSEGDLASLLNSGNSSASSATSSSSSVQPGTITETGADGSVTTITTNADGSVTTTTTPATASSVSSNTNALQDLLAVLQQAGLV